MSHSRRLEVVILFAVFLAVNLAGALFQKRISYEDGEGWEATAYYHMAREFAHRETITEEAPMVFRVGAPFLASRVDGQNPVHGFQVVNFTANVLVLALLIAWLRLYVNDWKIRVVLGMMYLLQWDAPTRWIWFFPVHTDPWLWVFLFTGLIALHHVRNAGTATGRWIALLCVTSFLGVFFREVALIIAVVLPFARNPITRIDGVQGTLRAVRWPPLAFGLPLVCGFAGLLLVRSHVTVSGNYSFVWTAQHWVYTKPLPVLAHSWLLAFGPMLFLVIYDWRRAGAFLAANQFLLGYGLAMILLGYIGGSDGERLGYWSMPVVYVLLGRALEEHKALLAPPPIIAVLAAAQLLSSRAFLLTPEYPNGHPSRSIPLFTPGLGEHFSYLDLFTYTGARPVEMVSLAEYLIFGLVLFDWLSVRRHKLARQTDGQEPATPAPPAPATMELEPAMARAAVTPSRSP